MKEHRSLATLMHAPWWNGNRLKKVSPVDSISYLSALGFCRSRTVDIGEPSLSGKSVYVIYTRNNSFRGVDDEIWVPLLRGSHDYLNQLCVFINDIALIEGVAQSDVYEVLVAQSAWGGNAQQKID